MRSQMKWFNKRKGFEDNVGKNDVTQLINNSAWQALTQQWEEEARELTELMLSAPLKEVRNEKGVLLAPGIDNVRGQLDNLIAVLTSAKILDEAIDADINIHKQLMKQNKPGGQENGE